MNFFNNGMSVMQGGQSPMGQNPFAQPFVQNKQNLEINQEQFIKALPNLNDQMLNQVANQARNMGISESYIEQGINFINNLRR